MWMRTSTAYYTVAAWRLGTPCVTTVRNYAQRVDLNSCVPNDKCGRIGVTPHGNACRCQAIWGFLVTSHRDCPGGRVSSVSSQPLQH